MSLFFIFNVGRMPNRGSPITNRDVIRRDFNGAAPEEDDSYGECLSPSGSDVGPVPSGDSPYGLDNVYQKMGISRKLKHDTNFLTEIVRKEIYQYVKFVGKDTLKVGGKVAKRIQKRMKHMSAASFVDFWTKGGGMSHARYCINNKRSNATQTILKHFMSKLCYGNNERL